MRERDFSKIKPIAGEERSVEWDEEFGYFGVFGVESGFCYSMHESEEQGEDSLFETLL